MDVVWISSQSPSGFRAILQVHENNYNGQLGPLKLIQTSLLYRGQTIQGFLYNYGDPEYRSFEVSFKINGGPE